MTPDEFKFANSLEGKFLHRWRDAGGIEPVRQHHIVPGRKWAWDFAFLDRRIAIEIQGGTWTGGRHTRGKGYESDCRKGNAAILQRWRILHLTTDMVMDNDYIIDLARWINRQGPA